MWIVPCAAGEPPAGLLACRGLADPTARLACFDREVAALGVDGAGHVTAPTRTAPVLDPKKQFGLPEHAVVSQEVAAGTRPADTSKIEARVLQFSRGADGRAVFGLDNDQVWRQLVSSGELLIRAGDAVTISRAALGSYWLQTNTGRGCKVVRVR